MIRFSNLATYEAKNLRGNITYILLKVLQGFTIKENYKGHCHVLMQCEGGVEWYLGNFSNKKTATAFIESVWDKIKANEGNIIDIDEIKRGNLYGQN